jgi:NAD-dependent dihydropyrimidine dehydrogenase PreA subunit
MLKYLPVVDPDACTSCVACVDVCTPGCLEMQNGLPVLTQPDTCGSDEHCVTACSTDAIRMEWAPAQGDPAIGKWRG